MSSEGSENFLQNKVVAISGAAGSIGSALCRRIARLNPKQLVILDCDETGIFDLYEELKEQCNVEYAIANIRELQDLFPIFDGYKPQIVIHAAAYKHVSLMEKFPKEAQKTNVGGTINMVLAAEYGNAEKFILISTDKAVNPSCVMGATKLQAEQYCLTRKSKTKFMVVRFGNVMASRGSLLPIWNKQIAENKPLTVTHPEMERYMMGIYEAADLVLEAARIGEGGEKFILEMGEQMKIKELAKWVIRMSGKPLDIIYTEPKQGEKFSEELMTEEEKKNAISLNGLYVIRQPS